MKYIYNKITIPEQKELYRHKNILIELGLIFDNMKRDYSNNEEISNEALEEIIWICKKNNFNYEVKEIEITDKDIIFQNLYTLISIDNNTFFIENKKQKKKVLSILINEEVGIDRINIIDIQKGKLLTINKKFENKLNRLIEITNILIEKRNSLESDIDIDNLIYVLSLLSEKYDKDNRLSAKLNKFKNTFISKILKDSPNKFLCNCVPGFNPEISFYLRDKRIINDLTNNPIDFKQETKIWEYLYKQENRKYIGVKKEPTLNDLFYMKKIKVLINNFETKYAINKIEQVHNKLKIHVFDGKNTFPINQLFSKEELFNKVKEAR